EELERHNLFVVPLDDARRSYRLHDLFREVLLARLHATEPALLPVLHGRAARWYAEQGELREAIPHALVAKDAAKAAALITRAAPVLWLRGEAATVQGWIEALPDAVVLQHARLALDAALHLLESIHALAKEPYAQGLAPLERAIARVEGLIQHQPALPDAEVALIARRIGLLRAQIAARPILARGDVERMRLLVAEADALAEGETVGWKLTALALTFWLVESLQREGALLLERLAAAKREAIAAKDQRATLRVMRWLAFAYLSAGRLRPLEEESLEALALLEPLGARSATTGYFQFFLADAYYALNRLP
ncbi:MAG: LuxR family transcriptional regulator, partial [Chloroflexales bacterium]|nr:LuxR family transcriptional regulator [Chloroflexales bacterium]